MNEERDIVVEDGAKEEPSKKLTPEQAKLVEAYKFKKMNKEAKAKHTAKKEAQAEAEKIKAELAVAAAAAAAEKKNKVLEENRKRDIREANEEKKLARALKPYKGKRI